MSGDSGSVGEELLQGVSILEGKVEAIRLAVFDGYFTFEEALKAYNITEEEYKMYNMKQNGGTTLDA